VYSTLQQSHQQQQLPPISLEPDYPEMHWRTTRKGVKNPSSRLLISQDRHSASPLILLKEFLMAAERFGKLYFSGSIFVFLCFH